MGRFVIGLLALAFLTVACGEQQPLTVEEYALWCAKKEREIPSSLREADTFGEFAEQVEKVVKEYRSVKPPEELDNWHGARASRFQAILTFARSQDADDHFNMYMLLGASEMLMIQMFIDELWEDLASDVRDELEQIGCTI